MSAFDELAKMGGLEGLMGVAMQIPGVVMDLREVLTEKDGDVEAAANDAELIETWEGAQPESRAAVLLSLAWNARKAEMEPQDSTASMYAEELYGFAREHEEGGGDSESFHGAGFPQMPLPGKAGAMCSSIAFDRDDLGCTLLCALLLMKHVPADAFEPSEG